MYDLIKSLLDSIGEYRVEIYNMTFLSEVEIELKIFWESEDEFYVAEYIITRVDEINRPPTKDATIEAIEEAVI